MFTDSKENFKAGSATEKDAIACVIFSSINNTLLGIVPFEMNKLIKSKFSWSNCWHQRLSYLMEKKPGSEKTLEHWRLNFNELFGLCMQRSFAAPWCWCANFPIHRGSAPRLRQIPCILQCSNYHPVRLHQTSSKDRCICGRLHNNGLRLNPRSPLISTALRTSKQEENGTKPLKAWVWCWLVQTTSCLILPVKQFVGI